MHALKLESSLGPSLFEEAFKEALPAMKALPDEEIVPVNLSIPSAVTAVLGLEKVLLGLEDRIAMVPGAERYSTEKLMQYALALSYVHMSYLRARRTNDPIPALAKEGMKLRSSLFSDARALAHRGLIDRQKLRNYKGSVGFRNLASDLHMLAQLFRDCPESVRASSAVRPAELHRADELAASILAGMWSRTKPAPAVQAAADLRNRAFTLLTRTYDQVRRAVVYLRWNEGDANNVLPSLYRKRRGSRKTEATIAAPTSEHAEQVAAVPESANAHTSVQVSAHEGRTLLTMVP